MPAVWEAHMSSDCHRLLPLLLLPQVEWSHLDIAGPVWQDKQGGATGFGAQLLAEWAVAQGR